MATRDVHEVLETLGLYADPHATSPAGGMSGSTVVGATTERGDPVVVKVTELAARGEARRALRELEVYTDLSRRLPLPSPRLIAAHRTEKWIALAIERHEPTPSASGWTSEQWIELAAMVGRMHRNVPEIPGRLPVAEPTPALSRGALSSFAQRLWNGPGDTERLEAALSDADRLKEAVAAGPRSFVHGDCHLGNVVGTTDGHLLLVDWQSAHVGPSASDIAFALTRAAASARELPRETVIDVYSAAAGNDPDVTRRAVTAHQLLTLVEQYPEFAAYLSLEEVRALRQTFDALLVDWTDRARDI